MNLIQVVLTFLYGHVEFLSNIVFPHYERSTYSFLALLYTIYFILIFAPLKYRLCFPFPVGRLLVQTFALTCPSVITLVRVELNILHTGNSKRVRKNN